jgi:hypothetical protein
MFFYVWLWTLSWKRMINFGVLLNHLKIYLDKNNNLRLTVADKSCGRWNLPQWVRIRPKQRFYSILETSFPKGIPVKMGMKSKHWEAKRQTKCPLQGCQMVYFQTKNSDLGKFWRTLQWMMLVYIMNICSILQPSNIFYGHLVYFLVNWYIFPRVGMLYQEKSGNAGPFLRIESSQPWYIL